jgi:hypothetical protein
MAPEFGTVANATAALLFIASATNAMDVYSATNSSPWTAYNFANEPESIEALWRYVRHAIAITLIINAGGALIARNAMPLVGAAIASAYMTWLYADAVKRGQDKGSSGWAGR